MRKGGPPFRWLAFFASCGFPRRHSWREFQLWRRSATALFPSPRRVASLLASSDRGAFRRRSRRSTTFRRRAAGARCHRVFGQRRFFVPSLRRCRRRNGTSPPRRQKVQRRQTTFLRAVRCDCETGRARCGVTRRRVLGDGKYRTAGRIRQLFDRLDRAHAIRDSTCRAPTEIARRTSRHCRASPRAVRHCLIAEEKSRQRNRSEGAAKRDQSGARSLPALRAAG